MKAQRARRWALEVNKFFIDNPSYGGYQKPPLSTLMISELFHVCMGKDGGAEGRKHEHLERRLVAALASDYHAALERKSPYLFLLKTHALGLYF